MLRFINFLKLESAKLLLNHYMSAYFRGGPTTSVLFWSTRTGGVQILRSIWTGGNHFGGVHFFVTELSAPAISISTFVPAHDSRHFLLSILLMLQVCALLKPKIWIFPLITYFRRPVAECCAVIGTHSTVQGDNLLYGHISDPFPLCGIGSGHTRLDLVM